MLIGIFFLFLGKEAGVVDTIALDVHAINELKEKKFQPTDDSIKYNYAAETNDINANYKFEACQSTVVALRYNKEFVQEVKSGQECGVLLDKTCFYAEQVDTYLCTKYLCQILKRSIVFSIHVSVA